MVNVSFKGNRMQDDDVASLDDIEMVELQLVPSVVDSDGETCGTVRQEVSLQLADDDKTYSVIAEVERKRIFCYLVPFKFRVPTAFRKQNAGVSCLKICNCACSHHVRPFAFADELSCVHRGRGFDVAEIGN